MRILRAVTDSEDTIVGVKGRPYHCPDEATYCDHVAFLARNIANLRRAGKFLDLQQLYRDDLDILLECRGVLEVVCW